MDPRERMMTRSAMGSLAHQYVGLASSIIEQAIGRAATDDELADFCLTAGSQLLGSFFAVLYDAKGIEEAERWMKKALAMVGSVARLEGSPALLKFSVEIKEVANANRRQPGTVEAPRPIPPCACPKTSDQKCLPCQEALAQRMKAGLESMKEMTRIVAELKQVDNNVLCRQCGIEYTDVVLSGLVPDFLAVGGNLKGKELEAFGHELLGMVYQISILNGVTELPLTEEVWKKSMSQRQEGQPG